MSNKLEDLKLLVKNDRRIWFAAAFLAFCLILFMLSAKPKRTRRVVKKQNPTQVAQLNDGKIMEGRNQSMRDLLVTMSDEVKTINTAVKKNEDRLVRMNTEREEDRERTAGIFHGLIDKVSGLTEEVRILKEDNGENQNFNSPDIQDGDVIPPKEEAITAIGFENTDLPAPPPQPPQKPLKVTHITAGDNVSLELLTGVAAPVDGTPYPVMFKVMSPIKGPDGTTLDVGEARIIAAAEGKETNSRVIFRLSELAIRHKDGRRSVIDIDGWIIGEDGIRGMPGELKDNLGKTIVALSTIASAQFLGDRIEDRADVNISSSDDFSIFGGGSGDGVTSGDINSSIALGVTDTFESMTNIIVNRFENQVPVVEILPGRNVQAVFATNAEVELIDEEAEENFDYDSSLS